MGLLVLTAAVKLSLAFFFFGFGTGDDTEIVLSAFNKAFSLPYEAWNIRNLVLPELVVAPFLQLTFLLGVRSTEGLCFFATFPFVLFSTASLVLVYRIALRLTESRAVSLLAGSLYAIHWIPLGFGGTTFPRTASTTCILAAFFLLQTRRASLLPPSLAGVLLAFAATVRYSEVIFLPAAAAVVLLSGLERREQVRCLLGLALGFLATALLTMGLFDWVRWGKPFSSLLAFGSLTLLEGKFSSLEAVQPLWWYLWRLPKWYPLTFIPFALMGDRKTRGPLAAMILVPVLCLSFIHHKELRYLQGVIPFLCLLTALGACQLFSLGRRKVTVTLLVVSIPWLIGGVTFVGRRSMAAVRAARLIAREPGISTVAFSQAWAYGANLYLPRSVAVKDLPVQPTLEELEEVVGSERICLYTDVVGTSRGLVRWLGERGYRHERTVRSGASRAVEVFARGKPPGPPPGRP